MAESRQRISYPKIIDKTEFKSPLRHLAEGSVTAALWAIWLYWILPILTLFLWLLGIRFFYHTLFSATSFAKLFEVLRNGGIAVITIFSIKLIWIYYNYQFIFKKRGERRRQTRICSDEAVSQFFNIDLKVLEKAKKKKVVKVVLENKKLTIAG